MTQKLQMMLACLMISTFLCVFKKFLLQFRKNIGDKLNLEKIVSPPAVLFTSPGYAGYVQNPGQSSRLAKKFQIGIGIQLKVM